MVEKLPDPLSTPAEVAGTLAERLKTLRLARNWKRETLARRAGVSPASLKRFETCGKISLENLLKLLDALGRLDELAGLLRPPRARTMEELEQGSVRRLPKRGSR